MFWRSPALLTEISAFLSLAFVSGFVFFDICLTFLFRLLAVLVHFHFCIIFVFCRIWPCMTRFALVGHLETKKSK